MKSKKVQTTISRRCPVTHKGKALMPMRWSRVKKYCKEGKGVLVKSKTLGWYLKLKVEPSGTDTQDCDLGIDPGTKYNAFSVSTKKVHNANFQRNTEKIDLIKKHQLNRVEWRRWRRNKLRHRPLRNLYRTGHRITKSCHYYLQVKMQMIKDICKIYPVKRVIIEDCKYQHYNDQDGIGSTFSNIEIGKDLLRYWIQSIKLSLVELTGLDTKYLRITKYHNNLKSFNKGLKSFYCHCIDSTVLSQFDNSNKLDINSKGLMISEYINTSDRCLGIRNLREFTGQAAGCVRNPYFRYKKGGVKKVIHKFHKVKKCRVKMNDAKSNHGPWNYIYNFTPNTVEYIRRGFKPLYGSFNSRHWNKFKGKVYYDEYLLKSSF